jgi:hypothetical protein
MANSGLTPAQVGVLMNEGTFKGLRKLLESGQITDAQARKVLDRSYTTLLGEVKEARAEMQRIQNALARLENLLNVGKRSTKPFLSDPASAQIGEALMAFDGWVVSLMETNLTITGMLNPAVTRSKIKEFGTAMNALMDQRAAKSHPAYKDPDAFDGYVNNWRNAGTAQGQTNRQ